jgi:hypothetical protein
VILIALLAFGGGLLDLWMRPATIARGTLLGSVDRWVHPSVNEWLR